jgi:PTH1 family peptidyl-tRNA hydrolase
MGVDHKQKESTRTNSGKTLSMQIKLIVGLGNPGADYEKTRHNAGAWLLEGLAKQSAATFRKETKFKGLCANVQISGQACWLLLPTTFMNLCGQSVNAFATFYQIKPEEILIAHDEIDLPVGVARIKHDGGHGGHNGLRDIIAHLHTKNFYRLRIGVGHPGNSDDVVDYVLNKPSRAEQQQIDLAIEHALLALPLLMEGHLQKAMNQLHSFTSE